MAKFEGQKGQGGDQSNQGNQKNQGTQSSQGNQKNQNVQNSQRNQSTQGNQKQVNQSGQGNQQGNLRNQSQGSQKNQGAQERSSASTGVASREEIPAQFKEIISKCKSQVLELTKTDAKLSKEEYEKKINNLLKTLKEFPTYEHSGSKQIAECERHCQNLLNLTKNKFQSEEWKNAVKNLGNFAMEVEGSGGSGKRK